MDGCARCERRVRRGCGFMLIGVLRGWEGGAGWGYVSGDGVKEE